VREWDKETVSLQYKIIIEDKRQGKCLKNQFDGGIFAVVALFGDE
jgi:hypothetical protein